MIWRTRFSSLAVSTRPQNETVSSKCLALQPWRHDSEAATSSVDHLEEKVQRNLRASFTAQMANLQGGAGSPAMPLKDSLPPFKSPRLHKELNAER